MAVTTYDLYEGSYYLLGSCELDAIEGRKLNGEITCRMSFTGENLAQLQLSYLNGQASANLFEFRRTYSQLSSLVLRAKKKFKNQLKQQESPQQQGGEAWPR